MLNETQKVQAQIMLRLIFVTGSIAHGGAERQTIALANRFAERGYECHAVYIKNQGSGQIGRLQLGKAGTVRCLNATGYFDRGSLTDFATHISRIGPAAIVAANPYSLMYSVLAMRLSGRRAPVVITHHATQLLGLKEQLQMLLYRPFIWMADRSVFVCHRQRRYWFRRGVFSPSNDVIHNGVDTDEFHDDRDPEERRKLRRALDITDTDYVIGISAVLRPEKNHLQLVDSIALLRKKGIPARALLIGDGEMREAIESRARELNVEKHLMITGFQADVRPYIAACDVMTLCSITEAFSLAALEAMALGRPMVHSDVGGAAEMIFPGRNGLLFPVGNTGAFVDKLAILADRAVSRQMGREAREVVKELFSEKRMVDRYEQTLLELYGTGPKRGASLTY